jgi:hypothetical protein
MHGIAWPMSFRMPFQFLIGDLALVLQVVDDGAGAAQLQLLGCLGFIPTGTDDHGQRTALMAALANLPPELKRALRAENTGALSISARIPVTADAKLDALIQHAVVLVLPWLAPAKQLQALLHPAPPPLLAVA